MVIYSTKAVVGEIAILPEDRRSPALRDDYHSELRVPSGMCFVARRGRGKEPSAPPPEERLTAHEIARRLDVSEAVVFEQLREKSEKDCLTEEEAVRFFGILKAASEAPSKRRK